MSRQRIAIPKATKEEVLKEYKHLCALCRKSDSRPEVHHIDEDPSNNEVLNLIPLCPNCHTDKIHNAYNYIETGRLQLFRRYKHPLILAPQFLPLFHRMRFLETDLVESGYDELHKKVDELIRLVQTHDKGEFYATELESLLRFSSWGNFWISFDETEWEIQERIREEALRKKEEDLVYGQLLQQSKEKLYELIIEMLSYQSWPQPFNWEKIS